MNIILLSLITLINLVFFIYIKKISKVFNVYDYPNSNRKIHKKKIPLLGGVQIIFSLGTLHLFLLLKNNMHSIYFDDNLYSFSFFFPCYILFFIGLVDDKFTINPYLKFSLCLITVIIILNIDRSLIIKELKFYKNFNIQLGEFSFLFTLLCFMLLINAINLFDGVNLQVGLYFIFVILALISKNNFINLSVLLFIILFFFLMLNSRNKIFLGDSGAFILAFIIAYFVIKTYNQFATLDCGKIFILMFLPGVDMFRLFILRLLKKKNPFYPDKKHIHHIMLKRFNFNQTTIIIQSFIVITFLLSNFLQNYILILLSLLMYVLILLISSDFKYKKNKF